MQLRVGIAWRIPALLLLGLGLAALWRTLQLLPLGTISKPDSGFFPALVSVLLIVFAAVAFTDAARTPSDDDAGAAGGEFRVWLVITALAVYGWALPPVGFVVCTAGLLVFLLRGIGRTSWVAALSGAAVASVACYLAFKRLGLPLPAGLLSF